MAANDLIGINSSLHGARSPCLIWVDDAVGLSHLRFGEGIVINLLYASTKPVVLDFYKLLNEYRTIRTFDTCFWACNSEPPPGGHGRNVSGVSGPRFHDKSPYV